MVNDNHHVAGEDMCVEHGGLCVSHKVKLLTHCASTLGSVILGQMYRSRVTTRFLSMS
jgi:hypothetical protein